MTESTTGMENRGNGMLLLLSVFVVAVCGLVYELIAGTLSSYLLGDSVTQFSLAIGVFLTAMGIGSYLSRFVRKNLLTVFILVEILVGVVGGATAIAGFLLFAYTDFYLVGLFGMVLLIGILVGMEIPLMIRILKEEDSLRVTVANVLSVDYVGAFAAALIFPFVLLPQFGLARAGMVIGLLNVAVGLVVLWKLREHVVRSRAVAACGAVSAGLLVAGIIWGGTLVSHFENRIYQDDIVISRSTRYQRLIVTRWRDDIRLFLNGHLQFSSVDEYRYHETLVHPAMSLAKRRDQVLILGGGDGMAAREVLKYSGVKRIDLVDLDPVVTDLFRDHSMLRSLNSGSLSDKRVHVHNVDAMRFLEETGEMYDVILMDLPDPSDASLGKLYSRPFYRLAGRRLAEGGIIATQATSPYRSREAFWCIYHTLAESECDPGTARLFKPLSYQTVVPTFGTWGFVLASREEIDPSTIRVTVPTKYLNDEVIASLFVIPPDMGEVDTPITELNDPAVSRLYRTGYHRYFD